MYQQTETSDTSYEQSPRLLCLHSINIYIPCFTNLVKDIEWLTDIGEIKMPSVI